MGTSRPQAADSLLQLRKRRTFSLPSFRRSAGGERQQVAKTADEMAKSAEEAVRVQKAAAWQWYTRGVGEAVVPTKRPPLGNSPPSQAPTDAKSGVDGTSKGGKSITNNSNVLRTKPVQPPQAESPRAASRFKAEASFTSRPNSSGPPPGPSTDGPSTPLYDEFELSGLRTQMADFVQRLQHQQIKDNEQSPADVADDHQKSKPAPNFPAATSVSTDHQQQIKAPSASVAAATANDHQLTKLPPSAPPVASTIPFHMRPISALHRLFRKVASGSIMKSTTNSLHSSTAAYEPEVIPEPEDDHAQYHYHHYIHHHHHHYHYGQSPEESAATIRSRARRHSESSGTPPRIPGSWEAESDDEEGEFEASPITAYLARRRRHSDSFAGHLPPKKAGGDEDEGMKLEETAKAALPLQLQRLYRSERFSPNKIPMIRVSTEVARPAAAAGSATYEFDEELADMKSRRRHSADYYMEEGSVEGKAEGGGKSGGGTYKLGGAAGLVGRRHSESSRKPEAGKRTPSPGRAYWRSPSDRFYADISERHAILARPRMNAALPPLYPQ